MNIKKIAALVPMRHHSERVPGKNYRLLAGKPLFHHILHTLQAVPEINQIVVDTDSSVIIDKSAQGFPGCGCAGAPEHLRADTIPMNEILLYDTNQVKADLYLQTHSTNPLLKAETISAAIQMLLDNYPAFDSLFSGTRMQTRLWDQLGRAINHNPFILLRTQDLPPVYEENSCIYLFRRETLETRRNRLGDRPCLFPMEASEAWDIDEELDFLIADLILSRRADGTL
jgi:CMP-N-acetylneuraminic acid synthetase